MAVEHLDGVVVVVLAADGEQHAARPQVEQRPLQGDERRALALGVEGDAVDPVLADRAAPQRVVEVDGQHLGDAADERVDEAQPLVGDADEERRADRHAHDRPLALVEHRLASGAGDDGVVVEEVAVAHAVELLGEPAG